MRLLVETAGIVVDIVADGGKLRELRERRETGEVDSVVLVAETRP